MVERIVEAELRLLADAMGPNCAAAQALEAAQDMFAPEFYRVGRRLFVVESTVDDTVVLPRLW